MLIKYSVLHRILSQEELVHFLSFFSLVHKKQVMLTHNLTGGAQLAASLCGYCGLQNMHGSGRFRRFFRRGQNDAGNGV